LILDPYMRDHQPVCGRPMIAQQLSLFPFAVLMQRPAGGLQVSARRGMRLKRALPSALPVTAWLAQLQQTELQVWL
jgi:hypothetical protein